MDFTIVKSEKDGTFDPVTQYAWNVQYGFIDDDYASLLKKIEIGVVEANNVLLQEYLLRLRKSLLGLIEDADTYWDEFVSSCEDVSKEFLRNPIYNGDTSDSIIEVINALVKLELVGEVEEYQEYIYECLELVFKSPGCPRPVLWRVVDEISKGNGFDWVSSNYNTTSSGIYVSLLANPVLGDGLLDHLESIAVGNFDANVNPSLTLKSIQKIYFGFMFYSFIENTDLLIGKYLRKIPLKLINFANLKNRPELNIDIDELSVAEYLIFYSRLLIEIKLGRAQLSDFVKSNNKEVRQLAFILGSTSQELKNEFEGKVPFNPRVLMLIKEMSN
jgi:hypothetical protein